MRDRHGLDEDLWGPAPSRREVAAARLWNARRLAALRLRHLLCRARGFGVRWVGCDVRYAVCDRCGAFVPPGAAPGV